VTVLAIDNLSNLSKKAIENNLFDTSAQSVDAIMKIGSMAITKTQGDGLASDKIFDIGILAVLKKDWYVASYALNSLKELLFSAVSSKINIYREPSNILEYIENLSKLSIKNGLGHHAFTTALFPILPEHSIDKVGWMAFHIKNEKFPKIETVGREKYCKDIISRLLKTLGEISAHAADKGDLIIVGACVDSILRITILALKEEFITIEEGLRDELKEAVSSLKRTFLMTQSYLKQKIMSPVPSEIIDAITSIAIFSLETYKDMASLNEVVSHCLKILHQICTLTIGTDVYGYDVTRYAGRIGVIGSYALYKDKEDIASLAVGYLHAFNKQYLLKSPNPRKGLHLKTLVHIYEKFNSNHVLPSEVEAYGELFKKVPKTFIDTIIDKCNEND
jgi:hypothetical protein